MMHTRRSSMGVVFALIVLLVCTSSVFSQELCADIQPESCMICHEGAGADHQTSYDELYQDGVIQVTDLAYSFSAPDTSTISFKMTKNGVPFDARDADSLGIYFVPYTGTKFQFEPAAGRMSLKGDLTYDGAGGCTSTLGEAPDISNTPGLIVLYGRDEDIGRLPARIRQTKYPFAALLETGGGIDYISAANNDGCQRCHTDPYLKHGYIYAQVDHNATNDFYTCKACHLDNGEGGHFEWQLLVDDPELAVEYIGDESVLTSDLKEHYAYKTSLMNDVHMSHAMEFPYPQSMANCVVCHEGKLDVILSEATFKGETCKSCHPVTGPEEGTDPHRAPALKAILPSPIHDAMNLDTTDCAGCHRTGGNLATFSDIHSGYDDVIYAAADLKYSEAIVVTVDEASVADNKLTIKFSGFIDPNLAGFAVRDIVPTVMVGLYGWDTKDFIVGPHERDADRNRLLEFAVDGQTTNPRFTTVSTPGSGGGTGGSGRWEVIADLSMWAEMIADGTVKRVEIAVMPELKDADGVTIALDARSRTFDLGTNSFDDRYFSPIVDLEGCHNCHEALATNYHSPDRGGSIVTCRMCHITKSRGSHLEMQSRSLDSYIHAIHSGQAFDIGDVNFLDPVEALHYDHHIEFPYPTHGIQNCESCHNEGTYEVPDQSKSLPGAISASDSPLNGWDRNIGEVPLYITGPGSRACGACHRADLINEDDASELIVFNQHTKQGGYLVEGGDDYTAVLGEIIDYIMGLFK